jgi:hypothetical protein
MWIKLWIKNSLPLLALLALVVISVTASAVRAQNDSQPTPTPADLADQTAALQADLNEPQPLDKLPPYILLVAQHTVPGAQFTGFHWDLSDNLRPLYELQGLQENKQLEISIFLDGSIDRVNRTITMSDVPVDVTGMLDKYVRDFEVSSVTEATLASGVNRFFEFAGRSGGINLVVEIADSASQIRIVELK